MSELARRHSQGVARDRQALPRRWAVGVAGLTSARPAVRPLTMTSVLRSSVLGERTPKCGAEGDKGGMGRVSSRSERGTTERAIANAPLRVRQTLDPPRRKRRLVGLPPPHAPHPRRQPAHVALVASRRVPAPEHVARDHAHADGGQGAREGLLGAEEGAGEGEARGVAPEEAAKDRGRRVAQREHDDGQHGNVCGCSRVSVRWLVSRYRFQREVRQ